MIAYWYHEGKVNEFTFNYFPQLTTFTSPIPLHAQLYIPDNGAPWARSNPANQWYQVNARNRLVNVPMDACKELRAALLLMGVSIRE